MRASPEYKKDIYRTPIFCPATRDSEGNWITHPTRALTYAQVAEDEKRICKSAGLKDLGSLYKYRKGITARLDRKQVPSQLKNESRSPIPIKPPSPSSSSPKLSVSMKRSLKFDSPGPMISS